MRPLALQGSEVVSKQINKYILFKTVKPFAIDIKILIHREAISKPTEYIKKRAFDLNCSAYYSRLLLSRKELATKGQE